MDKFKGYVLNNTDRTKHIFKKNVYPGHKLELEYVHSVMAKKVPEDKTFIEWLEDYLPEGWEVFLEKIVCSESAEYPFKEVLTGQISVEEQEKSVENDRGTISKSEVNKPSRVEFICSKDIDKLTARDLYNLRVKDNPGRIINEVSSIYKLQRALKMCKEDTRKKFLAGIIDKRIRKLRKTLP